MHDWQNLVTVVNDRERPVRVFFRDDDAGWANERLVNLCDRIGAFDIAMDLAVIPQAMDDEAEHTLHGIVHRHGHLLHLHQHGFAHANHQRSGRKCEFGPDRDIDKQLSDIATGRSRLHELFGDLIDPIFTPPWNRCSSSTCAVLSALKFTGLSRIAGSAAINHHSLADLSVAVDWQKSRLGIRLCRSEFLEYASSRFADNDVVGIMLHHELMNGVELAAFTSFLDAMRQCPKVEFRSMAEINRSMTIESLARESCFA